MRRRVRRGAPLDRLRATLRRIPNEPGVYRFLGAEGEVLYVGKAKALRKRVSSYLRKGGPAPSGRVPEMVARARDVEWVVTASESEALILEDNFIKEHRPPYNLRLRDDKSYPYIEITMTDEWPRVRFMRGRHVPGNLYFGPYSSARKVRDTLELIGRIFPYRKCKGEKPGRSSGSPCLQYFIKRSLAPCDGRVSREEYMAVLGQAIEFLRGRLGAVERDIERAMAEAAEAREFEKAALLRDRLEAVRHVHERQSARIDSAEAFDVIGLYQGDPGANVQVFRVRDGAVVDRQTFYVDNAVGREAQTVLEEFLLEYLLGRERRPAAGRSRRSTTAPPSWPRCSPRAVARPSRCGARSADPKRRLLELAERNAELAAQVEVERAQRRSQSRVEALERLRDALGPRRPPAAHRVLRHLQPGRVPGGRFDGRLRGRRREEGSLPQVRPARADGSGRLRRHGRGAAAPVRPPGGRRRRRSARTTTRASPRALAWSWSTAARDSSARPSTPCATPASSCRWRVSPRSARRSSCPAAPIRSRWPPTTPPRCCSSACATRRTASRSRSIASVAAPTFAGRRSSTGCPQVGPVRRRKILEHFGTPERFLGASREELERVPGLPRKVAREIHAHLHKTG